MSAEDQPLLGGACTELLPEVVDKYFFSHAFESAFEHYTARAICGQCAIRAACLVDAIGSPGIIAGSLGMVRAGESGSTIRNLRRRHFLGGEAVADLVTVVLGHETRTVGDFPHLRKGDFPDATPLHGATLSP